MVHFFKKHRAAPQNENNKLLNKKNYLHTNHVTHTPSQMGRIYRFSRKGFSLSHALKTKQIKFKFVTFLLRKKAKTCKI